MNKKYTLTSETTAVEVLRDKWLTLRRIRYTDGTPGGFLEGYHNLSQDGNAKVLGNAKVYGKALVCENAIVSGNARLDGFSFPPDSASLLVVSGNAEVTDDATIYPGSKISGRARVDGDTVLFANTKLSVGDADEGGGLAGGEDAAWRPPVELIYQDGGRYDHENWQWWSNRLRRWVPVDFNNCSYAEVEAVDKGMRVGSSFLRGFLTMTGTYHKYEFQLVVRGTASSWIAVTSPEFTALNYAGNSVGVIDELQEWEVGDAKQALQQLHREAVFHGWIPQPQRGFHWYSYTYLLPAPD